MKFQSFPKMRLWPSADKIKRTKKKGSITLITVFLFFVFSSLGLSMLYLSQIHLKLSGYKKNSLLLDYASENGIKQALAQLIPLLSSSSSPRVLSPGEKDELKKDARNGGYQIIEKLTAKETPIINSDCWENLEWRSQTHFLLQTIKEKKGYFKAVYKTVISSEGKLKNFPPRKPSILEGEADILVGNLPLPKIPVLIDKKLRPEQKANFKEKNRIEILPSSKKASPPQISFSGEKLMPEDASSQLQKALNIKIFYPQNLTAAKLRAALGLKETAEPVPEGVYLIKDDLGLGGIYVQGDVEEMILAVEDNFQLISILTRQGHWLLKFSPAEGKTIFFTPSETHFYDLIPLGIIMVNGKIRSLGGGLVMPSGQLMLAKEKEVPSVLQGVNLNIISSDQITISSHLIHQGVKWNEGIPYLKDSTSQLIVFATGKDFLEGTKKEGKIVIDQNSPQEIKLQASLQASNKGFAIEGQGKTVHLLGSLQASDYTSNQNKLKVTFDERLLEEGSLEDAPKTAKPVAYVASFKLTRWKEFK